MGAASAELISISSDIYLLNPTLPVQFTFSGRDAAGDMSADGGDALVHIQMTSGEGIPWNKLVVSIMWMVEHPTHALKAMHLQTACTVRMMTNFRSQSLKTTQTCRKTQQAVR